MHRRLIILLGLLSLTVFAACRPREDSPQAPNPDTGPIKVFVTPTPVPPTPIPSPASTTVIERYTVRSGDTLGGIAARYDLTVDELIRINGLANPNALQIGQVIKVTLQVVRGGPSDHILPDSEVVNGPAYANFDMAAYVNQAHGYLATYHEKVEGETISGVQVLQLVADRFSVGPRVLLTMLEYQGGWVTGTSPSQTQLSYPMGYQDPSRATLFYQASWLANRLNEGYYGKKSGLLLAFKFKDKTRARVSPAVNPGTAAIQNALAQMTTFDIWQGQVAPTGFAEAYRRLFGDPSAVAVEPLVAPDIKQPELRLPWTEGTMWFYTGGPHSAWGDSSAWAAIDVTPGDLAGSGSCNSSRDWALAAAPGKVIRSERARVVLSLSSNNHAGTGWVLLYMHIANTGKVAAGTQVNTGDRIGHPSCEGGDADASHLHFARLYNGQWMDPDSLPFVLSGWQVAAKGQQYEGTMMRGADTREALNGRDAAKNGISSVNGR